VTSPQAFQQLRLTMKVGDLVRYFYHTKVGTGIVLAFDEDKDPVIRDNVSGVVCAAWHKKVEVISANKSKKTLDK